MNHFLKSKTIIFINFIIFEDVKSFLKTQLDKAEKISH